MALLNLRRACAPHAQRPERTLRGRGARALAMASAMASALASAMAVAIIGAGLGAPVEATAAPATAAASFTRTTAGVFSTTVPNGVCSVRATITGGSGGNAASGDSNQRVSNANGAAAEIVVNFSVAPGETYSGVVGGGGTATGSKSGGAGGTPTGGRGGSVTSQHDGAGGGGHSALYKGTAVTGTGADLLVLAGGGGGSGGGHPTEPGVPAGSGFGGDAGIPGDVGVTSGSAGQNGYDPVNPSHTVGGGRPGTTVGGAGGAHSQNGSLNGGVANGMSAGAGAADPNYDAGGGGGGGYGGGGGGASTAAQNPSSGAGGVTGGGGGGGSSFVASEGVTIESSAAVGKVPASATSGNGVTGSVTLNWVECDYDLEVDKSFAVDGPTSGTAIAAPGTTVTWTVAVTNLGPDLMTRGDTVTLADSLPGAGDKIIVAIASAGGMPSTELANGPVTCNASIGQPMPAALECTRPFAFAAGTANGTRGLNVDETLTVTYEQVIRVADTASTGNLVNAASTTDRADGDTNDSSTSTVRAVSPPTAANDSSDNLAIGTPVAFTVTSNDAVPNGPATVTLCAADGTAIASPHGVAGEGSWTVSGQTVTFTPVPGYHGDPTPVRYCVTDANTLGSSATLTADYLQTAANDSDLGNTIGEDVALNVLANDRGNFDLSTLRITNGADPTRHVVVGEGTWRVDRSTGTLTFSPEVGFRGDPAPIAYRVADVSGDDVTASVLVTYVPSAADDRSAGNRPGTPVTVDVVGNDDGNLDPTSVRLIDAARGARVMSLRVAGEGLWTVNAVTGGITFTPEKGFSGNPTPVGYEVTDINGNIVEASVAIEYLPLQAMPVTGADAVPAMVLGGGLLALGLIALLVTRMRRKREV